MTDAPDRPAAAFLSEVDAAARRGELLAAYDLAGKGLEAAPDDLLLRHRRVLMLVRSGAVAEAQAAFRRLGLDAVSDPDVAALEGRLLKDLALAAEGPARRELAARSAAVYERLFHASGRYYQGVNAASMALMAGDAERARGLAAAVLGAIADDGSFWAPASVAEAALILGDLPRAAAAIAEAAGREAGDLGARTVTRAQLRRLAALLGCDTGFLAPIEPPAIIHFTGHMVRAGEDDAAARAPLEAAAAGAIAATLAAHGVGFGYGSLASGADILFAEALLARGAELNVVLPFPEAAFVPRSVAIGGSRWLGRFQACLAAASVTVSAPHAFDEDALDYRMASSQAMGLALARARRLDAAVLQVALWDGGAAGGPAGTAADVAEWQAGGRRTIVLPCPWRHVPPPAPPPAPVPAAGAPPSFGVRRRMVAALFGDFVGFSRLTERQYGLFFDHVVPVLARVLAEAGPALLYRNSWGDAVKLVFDDASSAAACGLHLQEALAGIDLAAAGLPAEFSLRLSGDFGPVLEVFDGVRGTTKYAGTVLTRAARIEPVTPPGRLFLTAAMAGRLLLEARPGAPVCDYVGQIRTAKNYGQIPVFAARFDRPG